jgi:hypothetical protein
MPGTDLQTQIDQLARRVAELERQPAVDESIQPSYLTISPDGTVGANFTGLVHAQGLNLDAGTSSTPPAQDKIRWLRVTDGAVIAEIAAYDLSDIQPDPPHADASIILRAQALDPQSKVSSNVEVINSTGGLIAALGVTDQTASGQTRAAQAIVYTNAGTRQVATILDNNGDSSFINVAGPIAKTAIDFGSTPFTWPGGTNPYIFTIDHQLGRAPTAVLVSGESAGFSGFYDPIYGTENYQDASFDVRVFSPAGTPGAGTNDTVRWIAIG